MTKHKYTKNTKNVKNPSISKAAKKSDPGIVSYLKDVAGTDHLFFRIALVIFISFGGFYAIHNLLMSVALCAYLIYMYKTHRLTVFKPGFTEYAVTALIIAYCVGVFFGIDRGMALTGASKLFCLLPFMLIMMQLKGTEKKSLITLIPFTGILSVTACTILLITPLREYVFIANRMSGFMGYANTFAFLMLAGILCEYLYCGKNPIRLLILSIGLFWSGSRTVFVMFVIAVIFLCIKHFVIADKHIIKHIILAIILFLLIVGISLMIPATSGIFKRLTDISLNSSTFQGRFLYMQDALPLIKRFPQGLGAYGYFYAGRMTATGLYTVKYIHNCILQLIVDTGIIPAAVVSILFIIAWLKNKNYTILFLFAHTLMDIDFEYTSVFMVLILIAEACRKQGAQTGQEVQTVQDRTTLKTGKTNSPSPTPKPATVSLAVCFVFTAVAILPGLSNMLFLFDDPAAAVSIFSGNTEAREERMEVSNDYIEIVSDAEYLISHNHYNTRGYQMLGTLAYLRGDAENTVFYLSKEIELVPYVGSEYRSFASYLAELALKAKESGDSGTYDYCVENIRIIYVKMKEKERSISFLGSRISEQPALYLDTNAMSLIKDQI